MSAVRGHPVSARGVVFWCTLAVLVVPLAGGWVRGPRLVPLTLAGTALVVVAFAFGPGPVVDALLV